MNPRLRFLALLCVVATACNGQELGEGHYRWEGIHGFAIWPEDQPEEAWAACREKIAEEPWRADPGETAEEFARSVLGWENPPNLSDHDVPEDAPRTVFTMIDEDMSDDALGIVVHPRQLKGCWFIARVQPREDEVVDRVRWVRNDGRFALQVRYLQSGTMTLEVGWGNDVHRKTLSKGEAAAFTIPDEDLPGHILWLSDDPPSESVDGRPLSPPPRLP
jgi:hypothetical protein